MASRRTANTAPPKAPSLKQKHYVDSLARQAGYSDGQAFYREWAGKNSRGFLTWNSRTVHKAIDELQRRIAAQIPVTAEPRALDGMPAPNAASAIAD